MRNIYIESFATFFKIGMFTLGGGYAMIPLIEQEVVARRGWVTKEEMIDLIAISQSCPGVFAINLSTFIGYRLRKTRGALCTSIGTAMPSFLCAAPRWAGPTVGYPSPGRWRYGHSAFRPS